MSYQLIPNLIFFLCVLGIIVLVLRRLPEAQNLEQTDGKIERPHENLGRKGIPVQKVYSLWAKIKFWLHQIWGLALEAKDLRPKPGAYNLKKLFQTKNFPKVSSEIHKTNSVVSLPVQSTVDLETQLLEKIKNAPKNRQLYDELGKYYLGVQQYEDAKDIYLYLVGHEVGNANFHARLAQAAFLLKDFSLSEKHFARSLALDKMHPNRYYNLGLAQECQGKWKEASVSFKKAGEMDSQNPKYTAAYEKAIKQIKA